MKHVEVKVTLSFHILVEENETIESGVRNWIENVDRVVFKDEVNYGNYELNVKEVVDCKCEE